MSQLGPFMEPAQTGPVTKLDWSFMVTGSHNFPYSSSSRSATNRAKSNQTGRVPHKPATGGRGPCGGVRSGFGGPGVVANAQSARGIDRDRSRRVGAPLRYAPSHVAVVPDPKNTPDPCGAFSVVESQPPLGQPQVHSRSGWRNGAHASYGKEQRHQVSRREDQQDGNQPLHTAAWCALTVLPWVYAIAAVPKHTGPAGKPNRTLRSRAPTRRNGAVWCPVSRRRQMLLHRRFKLLQLSVPLGTSSGLVGVSLVPTTGHKSLHDAWPCKVFQLILITGPP